MSDDMLTAAEYHLEYLQSPVDDLYSFYYTMQWAAVFHEPEFATARDIPLELNILRQKLSATQMDRLFVTLQITDPLSLRPREYGQVIAKCQPLLRAWYSELRVLRADWKSCQFELEEQETRAEIYIPLFSAFALRGVATLAELVYKYTKDMD